MIEITEEQLAELIAEGVEEVLSELTGKGKLDAIRSHHAKKERIHSRIAQVYDDAGEEDDTMEHGMQAGHHETSKHRASALIKLRNSLNDVKAAKRQHADNKASVKVANRNRM